MQEPVSTKEYYENYVELFATEGWKQFITECQVSLDVNNKIDDCQSTDDFLKRKGIVEAYNRTVNLEHFIRMSMENESDA